MVMIAGDCVVAVGDCETKLIVHRVYGVVTDPGNNGGRVYIRLADGRSITREPRNVAVYSQPPQNWDELYQRVEITCERKPARDKM